MRSFVNEDSCSRDRTAVEHQPLIEVDYPPTVDVGSFRDAMHWEHGDTSKASLQSPIRMRHTMFNFGERCRYVSRDTTSPVSGR